MIKHLLILLLLISSPALADVVHYTGGTSSATTAHNPKIELVTTDGGVSILTIPTNENLVYAMIPRAMYESGASDVNRNLGSAAFSGSTGWYHDPATGLLTHVAANVPPIFLLQNS